MVHSIKKNHILLCLLTISNLYSIDKVFLKNQNQLEGTIIERTNGQVSLRVIKGDSNSIQVIKSEDIYAIQKDNQDFEIIKADTIMSLDSNSVSNAKRNEVLITEQLPDTLNAALVRRIDTNHRVDSLSTPMNSSKIIIPDSSSIDSTHTIKTVVYSDSVNATDSLKNIQSNLIPESTTQSDSTRVTNILDTTHTVKTIVYSDSVNATDTLKNIQSNLIPESTTQSDSTRVTNILDTAHAVKTEVYSDSVNATDTLKNIQTVLSDSITQDDSTGVTNVIDTTKIDSVEDQLKLNFVEQESKGEGISYENKLPLDTLNAIPRYNKNSYTSLNVHFGLIANDPLNNGFSSGGHFRLKYFYTGFSMNKFRSTQVDSTYYSKVSTITLGSGFAVPFVIRAFEINFMSGLFGSLITFDHRYGLEGALNTENKLSWGYLVGSSFTYRFNSGLGLGVASKYSRVYDGNFFENNLELSWRY